MVGWWGTTTPLVLGPISPLTPPSTPPTASQVAFRKVAPALIAGNCVVLKPSELAGLAVMFFAQLAADAGIPAGVFNVVFGDRDAGQALTSHPDVGMVSFTGSSATGSKIMEACAPRCALFWSYFGAVLEAVQLSRSASRFRRWHFERFGRIGTGRDTD